MGHVRVTVRLAASALWGMALGALGMVSVVAVSDAWGVGIILGSGAVGAVVGYLGASLLIVTPAARLTRTLRALPPWMMGASIAGLFTGLLLGLLLSAPLAGLPGAVGQYAPIIASLVLGAMGVIVFLALGEGLAARVGGRLAAAGSVITGSSNGRPKTSAAFDRPILLDTSAIIDGRIADIGQSGFLEGTLLVPHFVLKELRHIADSSDPQRRNRGRRGLETLSRLRQDASIPVEVIDADPEGLDDVDDKLIAVASRLHASIVTTDFNLNRVAEIQGVRVLNVNLLASALRPVVIPGEELHVYIQQEGKEHDQGLAFLEDGTMIVVEGGRRFIGYDMDVSVTRVLQTAAGRIIFSHPKDV